MGSMINNEIAYNLYTILVDRYNGIFSCTRTTFFPILTGSGWAENLPGCKKYEPVLFHAI